MGFRSNIAKQLLHRQPFQGSRPPIALDLRFHPGQPPRSYLVPAPAWERHLLPRSQAPAPSSSASSASFLPPQLRLHPRLPRLPRSQAPAWERHLLPRSRSSSILVYLVPKLQLLPGSQAPAWERSASLTSLFGMLKNEFNFKMATDRMSVFLQCRQGRGVFPGCFQP